MDFNYNNLPDEEPVEVPQSKTGKALKKILKIIVYGTSLLIYLVLFWAIFNSCEPAEWKKPHFSPAVSSTEAVRICKFNPTEFTSYSGHVYLAENYYAVEANEMAFGVKLNMSKTLFDDPERLVFVLRDSLGNEYGMTELSSVRKSKYLYSRICFGDVKLDLDKNYYWYIRECYEEYMALPEEERPTADKHPIGTVYRLFVYEKDDNGKLIMLDDLVDHKFYAGGKELDESGLCVYNNLTVISEVD